MIPVTLTDNGDSWTLDNGIVKMTVLKRNGNISSLIYHGIETQTHGEYWEQTPSGTITARVTIDPATNGGERAEVSVLGVNPGDRNNPSPLGGPPGGGVPAAQEPRFPGAPGSSVAGGPAAHTPARSGRGPGSLAVGARARRSASRRPSRRRHGHRDALHHGARRQRLLHLRRVHPQGIVSAGGRGREPLHPGVDEPNLQLALRRQGPQPADDHR